MACRIDDVQVLEENLINSAEVPVDFAKQRIHIVLRFKSMVKLQISDENE